MIDVDGFIQEHLTHAYDSAKAHDYYMRTRKLKGRKPAAPGTTKRVEEDQVPSVSPKGAKIVNYDGSGSGKATYSDGSVFDGNGWNKGTRTPDQRLQDVHSQIASIEAKVHKIKDPKMRAVQTKRVSELRKQLDEFRRKHANAGKASVKQPRRTGTMRSA